MSVQKSREIPKIKTYEDIFIVDTENADFIDAYEELFNARFSPADSSETLYEVTTRCPGYYAPSAEDLEAQSELKEFRHVPEEEGYIDIKGTVVGFSFLTLKGLKGVIPALVIYDPKERTTASKSRPLVHPDGYLMENIFVDLRTVESPITLIER